MNGMRKSVSSGLEMFLTAKNFSGGSIKPILNEEKNDPSLLSLDSFLPQPGIKLQVLSLYLKSKL